MDKTKRQSSAAVRQPAARPAKQGQSAVESAVTPHPVEDSEPTFPVVLVIGGAGGIQVLSRILRALPARPSLAIVFVQTEWAKDDFALRKELLSSSLFPGEVVTRKCRITANRLFILEGPSARFIRDQLTVEPRWRSRSVSTNVEELLCSLANCYASRAITVFLPPCTGLDLNPGILLVRGEGGVIFATENGASEDGEPPTLPEHVDQVLPVASVAREIMRIGRDLNQASRIVSKTATALEWTEEYRKIFSFLRALTGVDFTYYKTNTLRRRILRRMFLQKISEVKAYVRVLQENPAEVDALFHDLLINVTGFFRDPHVFRELRRKVWPRILKRRDENGAIRIWVPGCSTGEEVYSLAICFLESLGREGPEIPIQIFGTDLSEAAITHARAGIYREAITSDVSSERLKRFFSKVEGGFQICKSIRDMCVFARQNVVDDPPFSKIDLLSCRNLLIYLGPVLQKRVMPVFHYALKPSGFLLLGTSESVGVFSDLFTLVDKKTKLYAKRVSQRSPELDHFVKTPPHDPKNMKATPASQPRRHPADGDFQREADKILLYQFSPNAAVVNSEFHVVSFRGDTTEFLRHKSGEASFSILKMAREELIVPLRSGITEAAKTNARVRRDGIFLQGKNQVHELVLSIIPFRLSHNEDRFFLVVFEDHARGTPAQAAEERSAPVRLQSRKGLETEIERLREELRSSKESLQAIIEEQEATNEELKSANEEIQSSNEELQSTNEEMETAREELQSSNEELTTLNEELHNRNSELAELNNDLGNLLSSVNIPILMLGNDLSIRRFTPQAEKLFNLIPADVGRKFSDINPNIRIHNLNEMLAQVIENLKIQQCEVQDEGGKWYSLRVRPYRTNENKIEGVVVVLLDIDGTKRALEEITSLVQEPLLMLHGDLRLDKANQAFYDKFRVIRAESEGKSLYEVGRGEFNTSGIRNLFESLLPAKNWVEKARIETQVPGHGRRSLLYNARRIYQEAKGTYMIVVTIHDLPKSPRGSS